MLKFEVSKEGNHKLVRLALESKGGFSAAWCLSAFSGESADYSAVFYRQPDGAIWSDDDSAENREIEAWFGAWKESIELGSLIPSAGQSKKGSAL